MRKVIASALVAGLCACSVQKDEPTSAQVEAIGGLAYSNFDSDFNKALAAGGGVFLVAGPAAAELALRFEVRRDGTKFSANVGLPERLLIIVDPSESIAVNAVDGLIRLADEHTKGVPVIAFADDYADAALNTLVRPLISNTIDFVNNEIQTVLGGLNGISSEVLSYALTSLAETAKLPWDVAKQLLRFPLDPVGSLVGITKTLANYAGSLIWRTLDSSFRVLKYAAHTIYNMVKFSLEAGKVYVGILVDTTLRVIMITAELGVTTYEQAKKGAKYILFKGDISGVCGNGAWHMSAPNMCRK